MNKKTRDLKKHYRIVEKEIRGFVLDVYDGSWYNQWHTHLDWYGITNNSQRHRRNHVHYYLLMLEKIEQQTKEYNKEFQTWIFLDGKEGAYDAIYFHTENPYSDFPYLVDNIEWNIEVPNMLSSILDLSIYRLGKVEFDNGNYYFIIQKNGLGKSLWAIRDTKVSTGSALR